MENRECEHTKIKKKTNQKREQKTVKDRWVGREKCLAREQSMPYAHCSMLMV